MNRKGYKSIYTTSVSHLDFHKKSIYFIHSITIKEYEVFFLGM